MKNNKRLKERNIYLNKLIAVIGFMVALADCLIKPENR